MICTRWLQVGFYTITNLQGSQTVKLFQALKRCFTPLQTYKVLKHSQHNHM